MFNSKKFAPLLFIFIFIGLACAEPKESNVSLTKNAVTYVTPQPAPLEPQPSETPAPVSANVDPQSPEQLKLAGVALYQHMCFECHGEIDEKNKRRGVDADFIRYNYTMSFPLHRDRPWPSEAEAALIEMALAIPKPEFVLP